jgi:hypothetical protein
VVDFNFLNIALPDSSADEPGSHGFVKFRVDQQPDLPDGTVLANQAAIYLDFNPPMLTNTALHTVGQVWSTVSADRPAVLFPSTGARVRPNPATDVAVVEFPLAPGPTTLTLFDGAGRVVRRVACTGNQTVVRREGLLPGVYGFRLDAAGNSPVYGRLIFVK